MQLIRASIFALLLAGLFSSPLMTPEAGAAPSPKRLSVFTQQKDGVVHFYALNLGLASVTATFDLQSTNLKCSAEFPFTTTLGGNQSAEIFTLTPVDAAQPWNYRYQDSCTVGSATAVSDGAVYLLPYAAGSSFRVSQGYHGTFSHTGPDEYAIDWKMPIGTPVHAAREGIVVEAKDDMNQGGAKRKFESCANCVLIQHPDGTIGIYGHLKQGGNKVKVGDHVNAGEVIALSGNTGYSNGPHLHFSVFKTKDGKERLSLPVQFRDANNRSVSLVAGREYTAAPIFADAPPVLTASGQTGVGVVASVGSAKLLR